MEETSQSVIQNHKRMKTMQTRQKNTLKRILEKLKHEYGSVKPIFFDIDILIDYIKKKGIPDNSINNKWVKKGFICTIDTRSGLQVTIRHDRDWKPHVYFIVDEYTCKISYYDESCIADVIMEIDALGEIYKMKFEQISAYLYKFHRTPVDEVASMNHAFEMTEDIQFRMDVAELFINNTFAKIEGLTIRERIFPYCDHLGADNLVRYNVECRNLKFTILFNPQGVNDTQLRFESEHEYIERELEENKDIFIDGTTADITRYLSGLFTDIERKVDNYEKEKAAILLEYSHRPVQLSKYPNAPVLPGSLKDSHVLVLPTFEICLRRDDRTDFSYEIQGEENVLFVPKSVKYNSDIKDVIYHYLDKMFMEIAEITLTKRIRYLSEKTGLKYENCSFDKSDSWLGKFCRETGTVKLNYYLVTEKRECIDAVIIHELCHSISSGHGLKFQKAMLQYAGRDLYEMDFKHSPYKKLL